MLVKKKTDVNLPVGCNDILPLAWCGYLFLGDFVRILLFTSFLPSPPLILWYQPLGLYTAVIALTPKPSFRLPAQLPRTSSRTTFAEPLAWIAQSFRPSAPSRSNKCAPKRSYFAEKFRRNAFTEDANPSLGHCFVFRTSVPYANLSDYARTKFRNSVFPRINDDNNNNI